MYGKLSLVNKTNYVELVGLREIRSIMRKGGKLCAKLCARIGKLCAKLCARIIA